MRKDFQKKDEILKIQSSLSIQNKFIIPINSTNTNLQKYQRGSIQN